MQQKQERRGRPKGWRGARPKQTPPEMPTTAELAQGGWTAEDAKALAWVFGLTQARAAALAGKMPGASDLEPDMEPEEKRAMLKGWRWVWVGKNQQTAENDS